MDLGFWLGVLLFVLMVAGTGWDIRSDDPNRCQPPWRKPV